MDDDLLLPAEMEAERPKVQMSYEEKIPYWKRGIWIDVYGDKIPVQDMDMDYLLNVLRFIGKESQRIANWHNEMEFLKAPIKWDDDRYFQPTTTEEIMNAHPFMKALSNEIQVRMEGKMGKWGRFLKEYIDNIYNSLRPGEKP